MNLINENGEWEIMFEDFSNISHWSIRRMWYGEN